MPFSLGQTLGTYLCISVASAAKQCRAASVLAKITWELDVPNAWFRKIIVVSQEVAISVILAPIIHDTDLAIPVRHASISL